MICSGTIIIILQSYTYVFPFSLPRAFLKIFNCFKVFPKDPAI